MASAAGVGLFACLVIACRSQAPCERNGRVVADGRQRGEQPHPRVSHREQAQLYMGQAILELLAARALTTGPYEAGLPLVDADIHALVEVQCGATLWTSATDDRPAGETPIRAIPIERMYPLDLVADALWAKCGGLMLYDGIHHGPAFVRK